MRDWPPTARASIRLAAWAVLLLALGPGSAARADDPPPDPPPEPPPSEAVRPPEPLAHVRTDPDGRATGRARHLARLWTEGAPAAEIRAALRAVLAVGEHVLVALDESGLPALEGVTPALFVPAAELVERLAWTLEPAERARLAADAHGGRSTLLARRARDGDERALSDLTAAPVLDDDALGALLARAEIDAERGLLAAAALGYARWRRLAAGASPGLRAEVALRHAETLALLGDADGLLRVAGRDDGLALRDGTVGELVLRRRDALTSAPRAARPASAPPAVPRELRLAWWRPLHDGGLRGVPPSPTIVTHGLHAEPGLLLLHEGRRVRRLEPETGVERWVFPTGPLGWDHHPEVKYQSHDLPVRCVTRAGDLVLAVLGDPGATGTFEQQRTDVDVDSGPRESRGRLVALDLATGALRWHTGAPREPDPILGARAASCISPPLVVGDDVYALFARRFGVVELYAACLSRADGRPRWVSFLGTAESGRDPGAAAADFAGRGRGGPVRAVPWGAVPALAEGELCVVPHAGLVAGLDPSTGRVRWLRALPRFVEGELPLSLDAGHAPQNAPRAVPGAWVLAPQDAPTTSCVERGTGALRWSRRTALLDLRGESWNLATVVRDLFGPAPRDAATPGLRVSGPLAAWLLEGLAPTSGDEDDGEGRGPWPEPGRFPGRALDLGPWVARVLDGWLHVRAWPGEPRPPTLAQRLPSPEPAGLGDADLHRAGDVWLALAPHLLCAYTDAHRPPPAGIDATRSAGEERIAALAAALELRQQPDAALLDGLERLPDGQRSRAFDLASRALQEARALEAAHGLLARWIDARPDQVVIPLDGSEGGGPPSAAPGLDEQPLAPDAARSAGELVAAERMRRLGALPTLAAAVARREAVVALRLEIALAGDDPAALAAALRTAVGTDALAVARRTLLERARDAGRFAEAAAWAADLRLDPPTVELGDLTRARAWAAGWQLREAGWLARAGDVALARSLLADLLRWVPSGTRDDEGRTTTELARALASAHGMAVEPYAKPARALRFAEDVAQPLERDAARAIVLPTLEGPGAWAVGERLVVARGLALEVRDLASGAVTRTLETGDQGWFGGSLQDVAPWLPERGVRVASVVAGEPADRAGVHAGDWIVSWGGRPLADTADLMSRIAASEPGVELPVEVLRGGRPVLTRFTAGRRPLAESGGTIERERVATDEQGRALVPVRNGLLRVDLARGTSERLWSHAGPGIVQRVNVTGGLAVVNVRRLHDDDLLVALDPATGRELWRRGVDGAVAWVRGVGSALHVQVDEPAAVVVLGRLDGRVRLVLPRVPVAYERYPNTLVRAETAAPAAGRVWSLCAGPDGPRLAVANTTTGRTAVAAEDLGPGSGYPLAPVLSADAYVAVIVSSELVRVFEPDPLADGVGGAGVLDAAQLVTHEDRHGGTLTPDSRVVCSGRTLFVLRLRPSGSADRGGATVSVFARRDRPGALRFVFVDRPPPLLPGGGEVYVTGLEDHQDGLLVAACTAYRGADGEHQAAAMWVPSADSGDERESSPTPWQWTVSHWRRSPPARVGPWLLLPDDRGAALVPLRRP